MSLRHWIVFSVLGALALALIAGGLYAFIVWEGSSARSNAPAIETTVAQCLPHPKAQLDSRSLEPSLLSV